MKHRRRGFSLFELVVLLALLLILLALLLPAVAKVRQAAARMQSINNLKQLALAAHNFHDALGKMPVGVDAKDFSGFVYMLPYLEQDNVYKMIDMAKSQDDPANAAMKAVLIKLFMSPLDTTSQPDKKSGPTSYFLVAGSKYPLEDNNGIFYKDSSVRLNDITDGTSNTALYVESVMGDGETRAVTVKRQHVRLGKAELKTLKDSSGETEFKANKHIVGDRGSSWMDGRFLRSTINLVRMANDERPDVDCGGEGGIAGARTLYQDTVNLARADGSVKAVATSIKRDVWEAVATRAGGEVLPPDF